jgi:hypothetical protein
MTPDDDDPVAPGSLPRGATVYEQSLDAVRRALADELGAARDRLATPAETEPLLRRLQALKAFRPRL